MDTDNNDSKKDSSFWNHIENSDDYKKWEQQELNNLDDDDNIIEFNDNPQLLGFFSTLTRLDSSTIKSISDFCLIAKINYQIITNMLSRKVTIDLDNISKDVLPLIISNYSEQDYTVRIDKETNQLVIEW